MSAIGEYIHLSYKSYMNLNTGHDYPKFKNYYSAYQKQKEDIHNKISKIPDVDDNSLKKLKDLLNKNPLGNGNNINNSLPPEYAEAIINVLKEKFGEKEASDFINGKLSSNFGLQMNKISGSDEQKISEDLVIRIQSLLKKIKNANDAKGYNKEETIKNIITEYGDIIQTIKNVQIKTDAELTKFELNDKNQIISGKQSSKNKELLSKIKEILNEIILKDTLNNIQGVFGELYVQAAGNAARNAAKESVDSLTNYLLESVKTGQKTSTFKRGRKGASFADGLEIKIDKIIQEEEKEANKNNINKDIKGKNSIFSVKSSQNKVDATIDITLDDNTTKEINASIKTYKLEDGLTNNKVTLQEVNLLDTLLATQDDFYNHWLNLHSTFAYNPLGSDVLKTTIAYDALVAGNPLKSDASKADTFIYINPINGTVKAASTKKMLETLDNFSFSPDVSTLSFKNKNIYAPSGPQDRIASILAAVYRTKIYVKYKIILS